MNSKHLIGLAQSLRDVARSKDVERRATVCNAAANALEQLAREQNTETMEFPTPLRRPQMLSQAAEARARIVNQWQSDAVAAPPPPVPMQWDEDVVHDAPVPGTARIDVDEATGNIRVTSTTDTGAATVWSIARNGPESFEGTVTTSQNEDEAPMPFPDRWLGPTDD